MGINRISNGLNVLPHVTVKNLALEKSGKYVSVAQSSTYSSISLWHKRFGHMLFNILKLVITDLKIDATNTNCIVCHVAKHTRLPFPISSTRSNESFALVHLDI